MLVESPIDALETASQEFATFFVGQDVEPIGDDRVDDRLAEARLIEIDGAQHGFAVHDDPLYRDPQTQEWQASVIRSVTAWLTEPG